MKSLGVVLSIPGSFTCASNQSAASPAPRCPVATRALILLEHKVYCNQSLNIVRKQGVRQPEPINTVSKQGVLQPEP